MILAFDSYNWVFVLLKIPYIIGAWLLLNKSGLKPWWALIPCAREYQLARCAFREPEALPYAIITGGVTAIKVINLCFAWDPANEALVSLVPLMLAVMIAVMITQFNYNVRVYRGFIEVYEVRKAWLLLCIVNTTRFIPMLVWGLGKNCQPKWKVEDLREVMERLATRGTEAKAGDGLVVNLKERTVSEHFKKKVLLRDIHMAIPQGHMVLLLGGSGAGKTTFINAVNGYEKADAEVVLNGTNMYTEYKKMQYEVGFTPQQDNMRGKDTVESTLLDAAKLRLSMDIPKEVRKQRVDEVMDIFGLLPVKENKVEKLSGGQRKRLSIAMEFLSNPSLFILDEPDSGLDGVMARTLFERLREIADSGKIVIVITHTPDRVIDLFDDVIVLAKDSARTGRLAFFGSIADARTFFGRERMEEIVKSVNQKEEGGDGLADEFVMRYAEVQHG